MSFHDFHEPPRLPRGFRCMAAHCGIKASRPDLTLFASRVPATAAAVFTRNHFAGAPVLLGRERIRAGRLQAVVVNSGVSNVATGADGLERARRMGEAAARELGVAPELVLVGSTGVIGRPLPIEKIEAGLRGATDALQEDPLVGAEAMMTTDTHPKALSLGVDDAILTLVGKGSGMIEPDLATMLVYAFTDARLGAPDLDRALRDAVHVSFNMLSVDTDTSTSDCVAVLANGRVGAPDVQTFREALTTACVRMAEMLARDGEGATRLLRVRVLGGASEEDARTVARAVVASPLVKTMAYGGDPNVGRILMAVGKCTGCAVEPERVRAWVGDVEVVRGGRRLGFDEPRVREALTGESVDLRIDLALGEHAATAYGCDLTEGYVRENAAYDSS